MEVLIGIIAFFFLGDGVYASISDGLPDRATEEKSPNFWVNLIYKAIKIAAGYFVSIAWIVMGRKAIGIGLGLYAIAWCWKRLCVKIIYYHII